MNISLLYMLFVTTLQPIRQCCIGNLQSPPTPIGLLENSPPMCTEIFLYLEIVVCIWFKSIDINIIILFLIIMLLFAWIMKFYFNITMSGGRGSSVSLANVVYRIIMGAPEVVFSFITRTTLIVCTVYMTINMSSSLRVTISIIMSTQYSLL